jgi:hypothetical protein
VLIGLSGKKQNGKTTLADYLIIEKGFAEVSWAAPLKNIIGMELLGLKYHQIYGTEAEKEATDEFWGKSPRRLLQIIGTDCFRNLVHPDFWVKIGEREIQRLLDEGKNVVVSDCRFPNEIQAVRKLGGSSVRVVRLEHVAEVDEHPSETALDTYPFDYVIEAKNVRQLTDGGDQVLDAIQA